MAQFLSANNWEVSVVAKAPDQGPTSHSPVADVSIPGISRMGVPHRDSVLLRIAESRTALRQSAKFIGAKLAQYFTSQVQFGVAEAVEPTPSSTIVHPNILRTLLFFAQERRWANDAVRQGKVLVNGGILVSSGPPHSIHYAVSRLARQLRLPHVVDMRDPWSLVERSASWMDMRLYRRISHALEKKTLEKAALIVCNTGHAAEALQKAYPKIANRIIHVMNGADPEDIPETPDWTTERFTCVHSGTIYLDRMPVALLRAARIAIDQLSLSTREFGVAFRGVIEERMRVEISELAASLDLSAFVEILPRIDRQEAMRWTALSQMCVVLPQDSKMALPSKVFELAQLRSWMLVFAPEDSATSTVLLGTSATVVGVTDATGAADAIINAILAFRSGIRPEAVDRDGTMLRSRQAEKLRQNLVEITRATARK